MNEETQAIIEEIEGELGDSPIENFGVVDLYMRRYPQNREVVEYLNSVIEEKLGEKDMLEEAEYRIPKAEASLDRGDFEEAYEILAPYRYHPDFSSRGKGPTFDPSCGIEYRLLLLDHENAEAYKGIHFGYISYLLGRALYGVGNVWESFEMLHNASSWNPYFFQAGLEEVNESIGLLEKGYDDEMGYESYLRSIKEGLMKLLPIVYRAFDFATLMGKLGDLLVKEKSFEQARACYLFSNALLEALGEEDGEGKAKIKEVDGLLGNEDHMKGKELIDYLRKSGLPFQLTQKVNHGLETIDERAELSERALYALKRDREAISSVAGDYQYQIAIVAFPDCAKEYEYLCYEDSIEEGGVVLVPTPEGDRRADIMGKRYASKEEMKASCVQYQDVIKVLLYSGRNLEHQYCEKFHMGNGCLPVQFAPVPEEDIREAIISGKPLFEHAVPTVMKKKVGL